MKTFKDLMVGDSIYALKISHDKNLIKKYGDMYLPLIKIIKYTISEVNIDQEDEHDIYSFCLKTDQNKEFILEIEDKNAGTTYYQEIFPYVDVIDVTYFINIDDVIKEYCNVLAKLPSAESVVEKYKEYLTSMPSFFGLKESLEK